MKIHAGMAVLASLVSVSAFAFPTVGDHSAYECRNEKETRTIVLQVTSVDEANDAFQYDQITTPGSPARRKTTWPNHVKKESSDGVISDVQILMQAVDYCLFLGGVIESMDVAGQKLDTCHLAAPNSDVKDVWFGNAPFGIIRELDNDGEDCVLDSFKIEETAGQQN